MVSIETPSSAPGGEVVVYEAPGGEVRVDVRLEQETVWLTQRQMAEVLQTSTDNVSLHLRNIYSDGELEESATTEDFSTVRAEGKRQVRRVLKHYNLDAIISVGYRVNSRRGVRFRQWATRTLSEHLVHRIARGASCTRLMPGASSSRPRSRHTGMRRDELLASGIPFVHGTE